MAELLFSCYVYGEVFETEELVQPEKSVLISLCAFNFQKKISSFIFSSYSATNYAGSVPRVH